jgi:hypothetical protein
MPPASVRVAAAPSEPSPKYRRLNEWIAGQRAFSFGGVAVPSTPSHHRISPPSLDGCPARRVALRIEYTAQDVALCGLAGTT